MASRRKKIHNPQTGTTIEGEVIGVSESAERFSVVKLEDGTYLRIKAAVVEAVRLDNEWDDDGNPRYIVRSHNVVIVDESSDELKKDKTEREVH